MLLMKGREEAFVRRRAYISRRLVWFSTCTGGVEVTLPIPSTQFNRAKGYTR